MEKEVKWVCSVGPSFWGEITPVFSLVCRWVPSDIPVHPHPSCGTSPRFLWVSGTHRLSRATRRNRVWGYMGPIWFVSVWPPLPLSVILFICPFSPLLPSSQLRSLSVIKMQPNHLISPSAQPQHLLIKVIRREGIHLAHRVTKLTESQPPFSFLVYYFEFVALSFMGWVSCLSSSHCMSSGMNERSHREGHILVLQFIFIYSIRLHMSIPYHACGSQRATCRNWFSNHVGSEDQTLTIRLNSKHLYRLSPVSPLPLF